MAIFIIMHSLPSSAQKLEVGIGFGYTHFTAPDKYVNPISKDGYGFTEAHPILVTIRYSRHDAPLSFSLTGIFQKLYGRGMETVIHSESANLRPDEVENNLSLWSVSLGTDWNITKAKYAPHLSLEYLISSMGDLSRTIGTPQGDYKDYNKWKTGSIQSGLGCGVGFNIPLLFDTALRLDARYIFYGLFGRPTGEHSVNSVQFTGIFILPIWSSQAEQQEGAP